jgi:mannose-6-phosphate isomerase-like protein (cupin superfamily)
MNLEKVSLTDKFSRFSEQWSPKIAGELNDSYVKLVKFQGDFVWHHHDHEDELFLVIKGRMLMRLREPGTNAEREIEVHPGEFIIIPKGVEHRPSADEETQVVLLEPKTTLNTGNVRDERTRVGSVSQIDNFSPTRAIDARRGPP